MVFYLLGIPSIFGDFNRLAADKVQESLHGDLRLKRLHVHPGKSYIHSLLAFMGICLSFIRGFSKLLNLALLVFSYCLNVRLR